MKIIFLYAIAIAGAAVAVKSKLVWEECGAVCPAFPGIASVSATFGWYFGLVIVIAAVLLITWNTFHQS